MQYYLKLCLGFYDNLYLHTQTASVYMKQKLIMYVNSHVT